MYDYQALTEINILAGKHLRDGRLSMKGIPPKLRAIADAHLKSKGIEVKVKPISMTAVGDELVVVQTRNTMTLQGQPIAIDVVVVWRFVDGRIAEVWDIPSVYASAAAR